jgi:electron transport complex protein RnfG
VLAGGGAVAGLLLVVVHLATIGPIEAHRARVLADGVREVLGLGAADACDPVWLEGEALTTKAPPDGRAADLWRGRRADGAPAGWALVAEGSGFAGDIGLLVGWDAAARRVLALKVLRNVETPGLGDKIGNDPSFAAEFANRRAPVRGVKPGRGTGGDDEVDTITGATVSSRAVIRIVNRAVETWADRIAAWREEAPR